MPNKHFFSVRTVCSIALESLNNTYRIATQSNANSVSLAGAKFITKSQEKQRVLFLVDAKKIVCNNKQTTTSLSKRENTHGLA
jgi:hypothetical protein